MYSPGQPAGTYPMVEFNICGSVSQAVAPCAPMTTTDCDNGVTLPLPHSHGVAIQYINDPAFEYQHICADVDTCDQDTNPTCAITCTNPNNIASCVGSCVQRWRRCCLLLLCRRCRKPPTAPFLPLASRMQAEL